MGGKGRNKLLLALAIVGVEVAREVYVLKRLGFMPDKFIEWIRGDSFGSW